MNDRIVPTPSVFKPSEYTQAVRVGNMLFLAGQTPLDKDGNLVGPGDFEAQTVQVFKNLQAVLEDAGGSFRDVVKLTTYMLDGRNREKFSEIRARFFGDYLPPSTLVVVHSLALEGFLVEVEALAILRDAEEA